jgi:hypothetical protein
MEFVRVANKAELPVNKMMVIVVGGKDVLLANADGSCYHRQQVYPLGSLQKVF